MRARVGKTSSKDHPEKTSRQKKAFQNEFNDREKKGGSPRTEKKRKNKVQS